MRHVKLHLLCIAIFVGQIFSIGPVSVAVIIIGLLASYEIFKRLLRATTDINVKLDFASVLVCLVYLYIFLSGMFANAHIAAPFPDMKFVVLCPIVFILVRIYCYHGSFMLNKFVLHACLIIITAMLAKEFIHALQQQTFKKIYTSLNPNYYGFAINTLTIIYLYYFPKSRIFLLVSLFGALASASKSVIFVQILISIIYFPRTLLLVIPLVVFNYKKIIENAEVLINFLRYDIPMAIDSRLAITQEVFRLFYNNQIMGV